MGNSALLEVFDVIERAQNVADVSTLVSVFREPFHRLGATDFVWGQGTGPGGIRAPRAGAGKGPPAWQDHYVSAGLVARDPLYPRALQNPEPFTWRSARLSFPMPKAGIEVLEQARSFGLEDGYVMPIHHLNGSMAGVILYARTALDWSPREALSAHMLSIQFATMAARLTGRRMDGRRIELTHRQRECLQWVRGGKTDWEIATILGLSEHTVAEHLEAARRRLGVKTRAQAVIDAISLGLITL